MSEIIEHRMNYIPVQLAEDGTNMQDYIAAVAGNMLIAHEKTWDTIQATPGIPALTAGHQIFIKDPDAPADRYRTDYDGMYPSEHGTSIKYFDTIDQAIGYAAQLRSLVRLSTGKFMHLAVLDYSDSDLIGELREVGYAPKE